MMLQAKVWSLDQQWRTSGVVHALEAAEVAEADTEEVDFFENIWGFGSEYPPGN